MSGQLPVERPWDAPKAPPAEQIGEGSGAVFNGVYWIKDGRFWDGTKWRRLLAGGRTPNQPDTRPWIKRNMIGAVVGAVALIAIIAVGIAVAVAPPSTRTTTSSGSGSGSVSGLGVRDSDYVRLLGARPTGMSQATAITTGRQVCDIFDSGGVGTDAIAYLLGRGLTGDEAARVIFAAVESYCIEYELDAQR